jgi:peptidoglycan hydrolase CwlO-like protein
MKKSLIIIAILILSLILPNFQGLARTPLQERKTLEAELAELERQIAQYEANINKTEKEKKTLRNQISILRDRIAKLNTQIRQGDIVIRNLGAQIKNIEASIEDTFLKIEDLRKNLAVLLRVINREKQQPLIEVFLAGNTLSDFFNNLNSLETLNIKNKEIYNKLAELKLDYGKQKKIAENERQRVENIVVVQILRKEEADRTRKEQSRFLRMTEAEYQKYLKAKAEAEKRIAEIRARLFELIDIPDAPTFGKALELAGWVEQKTGIRPAFLLAIITQESALGRNVGRCYLNNFETGESIHIRTGDRMQRGMHPRRDVPHFLNITRKLGRDPRQTLISCPMAFGWGGAMGPAQFIPSTWVNRLPRLEPFIQETPNPWNIRHAFLASGLYLQDLGGRNNERTAALRYFAGNNWNNPDFSFYGNQVVQRINCLQIFIDDGTMTSACERMIFIPR